MTTSNFWRGWRVVERSTVNTRKWIIFIDVIDYSAHCPTEDIRHCISALGSSPRLRETPTLPLCLLRRCAVRCFDTSVHVYYPRGETNFLSYVRSFQRASTLEVLKDIHSPKACLKYIVGLLDTPGSNSWNIQPGLLGVDCSTETAYCTSITFSKHQAQLFSGQETSPAEA